MCLAPVFPCTRKVSDLEYCAFPLSKLKYVSYYCLNNHSLLKNLDSAQIILQHSQIDCHVLNETFLNTSMLDNGLEVPNYILYQGG